MKVKRLFLGVFLLFSFVMEVLSAQQLRGGELLKVDFSFFNTSNIPLTNKIIDVKLRLAGKGLAAMMDYKDTFIVFPEKTITFSFNYLLPVDFYGKLKVWLEVYQHKKVLYISKPIVVEVARNYRYYLLQKVKKRYKEELKIWKDFSDRPSYYFAHRTKLPQVKKAIRKLMVSPLVKKVLSEEDYYMLKVALHRIKFYLKKHPTPKKAVTDVATSVPTGKGVKQVANAIYKDKQKIMVTGQGGEEKEEVSVVKEEKVQKNRVVFKEDARKFLSLPIGAFFYYISDSLPNAGEKLFKRVLFYFDRWSLEEEKKKTKVKVAKNIKIKKHKQDSSLKKEDVTKVVKKLRLLAKNKKVTDNVAQRSSSANNKEKYLYLFYSLVIFMLTIFTLKRRLGRKDTFNKALQKGTPSGLSKKKASEAEDIMSRLDDRI